jgi:EAL domain-containing protein (putative c-di-GMP-specific phosphodiesterase class I)
MGQGYFYGRPVDAAATQRYLHENYREILSDIP